MNVRATLRNDQWDLIVIALQDLHDRATNQKVPELIIDVTCRKITKRRCLEAIQDIRRYAPEAWK